MFSLIAALQAAGAAEGPRLDPLVIFFITGAVASLVVVALLLRPDPEDSLKPRDGSAPGNSMGAEIKADPPKPADPVT